MKSLFVALFAMFAVSLTAQTTDLQYQAHVPPGISGEISFSAYIADNSFNEDSHLNATAFWYVENQKVEVFEGIINVLLEDVPNSVFLNRSSNIFVYAYVNGVKIGKLPLHKVPYALHSEFATNSDSSKNSLNSVRANEAGHAAKADTSLYAVNSGRASVSDSSVRGHHSVFSTLADSAKRAGRSASSHWADSSVIALEAIYSRVAGYSANSGRAEIADSAFYSIEAGHSVHADSALYAINSNHSIYADTALYSVNSGYSATSGIANNIIDSVLVSKHFNNNSVKLPALDGGSTAPIGSYAMAGATGLRWAVNPHHFTTSVSLYTVAPLSLTNTERYIVSRVAVDYNMVTISNPTMGQIVTVYNGSTANVVTLRGTTWNIDTMLDVVIWAGQSRTLWFNGVNWMVIQ
jgi:hypothetical protein